MRSVQRESWQNVIPILSSKAEVASFCLELSKKMGMRYKSPPLPVNLTITRTDLVDFTPYQAPAPAPPTFAPPRTPQSAQVAPSVASGSGYNMKHLTSEMDSFAAMFDKPKEVS